MKEEFDFYNSTSIKSYNLNDKIRYQLKMLDSMDNFTRKHSENVANITCRLCENLHMSKGFTIYCTTCAYIHDIGKLFIPPSVLQKPGKLTAEEYEIMKSHTSIGYKMCMEDLQLRPYAAGTLYHHESLNGTGYPNGLKGNKIPYEAQIIRVADEFEAITARRQYKTHIGIIDTLKILISNAQPQKSNNANIFSEESRYGKIDKKILKALFKVVIEDTEYEINARLDYLNFLKSEIKRIKLALKEYKKMEKSKSQDSKEFHRLLGKGYLKTNEDLEKTPLILQELEEALIVRKNHISTLYNEIKQIKKLKI